MVGVIVGSKKTGINPDNVATPIAASFGDLITLAILAWISQGLYKCLGRWSATNLLQSHVCVQIRDLILIGHYIMTFSIWLYHKLIFLASGLYAKINIYNCFILCNVIAYCVKHKSDLSQNLQRLLDFQWL